MFRVVEEPGGVTRVYRASTNELVCSVKEQSRQNGPGVPDISDSFATGHRKWRNGSVVWFPSLREPSCDTNDAHGKIQTSFLRQLELQPTHEAPRALLERLPTNCGGGIWPGAITAVENYNKHCSTRGRQAGCLQDPFAYAFRGVRQRGCGYYHIYTFGRRQRLKRSRQLATGMSARTWRLLERCKPMTVALCRLSSSEVSLWTRGHLHLNRTPLREISSFLRPIRCVLPGLAQSNRDLSEVRSCASLGRPCAPS